MTGLKDSEWGVIEKYITLCDKYNIIAYPVIEQYLQSGIEYDNMYDEMKDEECYDILRLEHQLESANETLGLLGVITNINEIKK